MNLRAWLHKTIKRKAQPSISRQCLSAMVKACSVSGPYTPETSLRDYARDFLGKYQDGDFRAKFGMPTMDTAELIILGEAAGW